MSPQDGPPPPPLAQERVPDRNWEILEGPTEKESMPDERCFGFRYGIDDAEYEATVILSGPLMASAAGLPAVVAEVVVTKGRAALIGALRHGQLPKTITVYADGSLLEEQWGGSSAAILSRLESD